MPVFVSEDGHASSELSHKKAQSDYHLGLSDFKPFLTGFSCFSCFLLASVAGAVVVVVVGVVVVAGAG